MASWPTTLPVPLRAGYALNPADQTVRTDMEAGAARARRRTTARMDKITLGWFFTDAQMAIFRAWFENSSTGAAGGAGWFTITLRVGDGGASSKTCRFIGIYQSAREGTGWHVSGTVEVQP